MLNLFVTSRCLRLTFLCCHWCGHWSEQLVQICSTLFGVSVNLQLVFMIFKNHPLGSVSSKPSESNPFFWFIKPIFLLSLFHLLKSVEISSQFHVRNGLTTVYLFSKQSAIWWICSAQRKKLPVCETWVIMDTLGNVLVSQLGFWKLDIVEVLQSRLWFFLGGLYLT